MQIQFLRKLNIRRVRALCWLIIKFNATKQNQTSKMPVLACFDLFQSIRNVRTLVSSITTKLKSLKPYTGHLRQMVMVTNSTTQKFK